MNSGEAKKKSVIVIAVAIVLIVLVCVLLMMSCGEKENSGSNNAPATEENEGMATSDKGTLTGENQTADESEKTVTTEEDAIETTVDLTNDADELTTSTEAELTEERPNTQGVTDEPTSTEVTPTIEVIPTGGVNEQLEPTDLPTPTSSASKEPSKPISEQPKVTDIVEEIPTASPELTKGPETKPTVTNAIVTKMPETMTNTPKPTATNTLTPTSTNTPKPTATNTPKPTATYTPKPTATNTPKPTATNTPKPTATNSPSPTPTVHPEIKAISGAKVGDIVAYGRYEQDGESGNGKEDIKWIVLEKTDDRVLLISEVALDCNPYNENYVSTTWASSELREWMNHDFYNAAFSAVEKEYILTTNVPAETGVFNQNPGPDTKDKVYLLSVNEAKNYFESDLKRRCGVSDYSVLNKIIVASSGYCNWWLRTPGIVEYNMAYVEYNGKISESGRFVTTGNSQNPGGFGIRPVVWVSISR